MGNDDEVIYFYFFVLSECRKKLTILFKMGDIDLEK